MMPVAECPAFVPSEPAPAHAARLGALRAQIAAIGGAGARPCRGRVTPLGVAAIDAALPWGGLPGACLHEMAAGDAGAAAVGFCARLLARMAGERGAVVWIRRRGGGGRGPAWSLYAPGLVRFGLDPARLLVAHARSDTEVLWAMEEALRSGAPAAVLGETAAGAPIALRRLQLAAERGGVPALLLRPFGAPAVAGPATTRWRVSAAPSARGNSSPSPSGEGRGEGDRAEGAFAGPGARWRVALLRCAAAAPGEWMVEGNDEAHRLAVAAAVSDRPAAPAAPRRIAV